MVWRTAVGLLSLIAISPRLMGQPGELLPVYFIVQSGAQSNQAAMLENFLSLPTNIVSFTNGEISFVDPTNYMFVPTIPITDSNVINLLQAQTVNKAPGIPLRFEQLDFAGVSDLTVMDSNSAVATAQAAVDASGLAPQPPESATPVVAHTVLMASYTNDQGAVLSVSNALDTDVRFVFSLSGGYPLIGPGTQVQFTFGANGAGSRLEYAARQLAPGPQVQIISAAEAINRAAALFPGLNPQITPQLVYYAPPLSIGSVINIIPWYQCGGTGAITNPVTGQVSTFDLIPALIPATDDSNYVPSVNFAANIGNGGAQIVASASVSGGTPPYTYEWSGSSQGVISNTVSRLVYTPTIRVTPPLLALAPATPSSARISWSDPTGQFALESSTNVGPGATWTGVNGVQTTNEVSALNVPISGGQPIFFRLSWAPSLLPKVETVGVNIIDANGITIKKSLKLGVLATPIVVNIPAPPQQIGWGVESPYDPGLGTQDEQDWTFAMDGNSVFGSEELWYIGDAAESVDFLDAPGGDNDETVDQTDITLYIGHGNPDEFTFTSPYSGDSLGYNQPFHTWGNRKQEWMCLLSCEVLEFEDAANANAFQRWTPAFDGLHILMGFVTDAEAETGFPTTFVQYMGGKWFTHIANAWCAAAKARNVGTPAVLAPFGPGGVTDINDDWWGLGTVGPRIRASQITGFAYETSLSY